MYDKMETAGFAKQGTRSQLCEFVDSPAEFIAKALPLLHQAGDR